MAVKGDRKVKLLLEDLASLESYIHDLFAFSPLPICFVSPIGVILEANPAVSRISGYEPPEIIGEPVEKFFEDQEIQNLIQDTLEQDLVEGREIKFFPKQKESIPVQGFTRARKDEQGRTVGLFLGLFDLTEIKQTEQELRDAQKALLNMLEDADQARQSAERAQARTSAVITNLTDGLLLFDPQNKLSLINPKAENFLEVESGKVVGKTPEQLAEKERVSDLIELVGPEIKGIFRKELELTKDLTVEVSTIPLMREEKKTGTLVVLHDVSREKVVERLKTEFVSLAAHQLRTPLSAIKWTLKMLLDGDLGEITEEQKEFIEKTYRSNERMIKLINDLLNVTRIEEGRYLYQPVMADLRKLCQKVIEKHRSEIKRKKIEFEFERPERMPKLRMDKEKMRLGIDNLLDNAIRYTKKGGRITITLEHQKDQDRVRFSIEDTGVGIPQGQQSRVFTKFFRGSNATRLETEGTGLGLFITKNIIEAHSGRIWFESEPGEGTTFYFTLPVQEEFEKFVEGI